jgi:hypothetical protein
MNKNAVAMLIIWLLSSLIGFIFGMWGYSLKLPLVVTMPIMMVISYCLCFYLTFQVHKRLA